MDADAIYTIYNNPEILKSYSNRPIANKAATIDFITKITSNENLVWNIRLQQDKENIIGNCALHDWNKSDKTIEIGGTILPSFWGQGIMLEAFNLICAFAAKELGVNTIIGKTMTKNKQAIRLVEKLGFNILEVVGNETILAKKFTNSSSQ